MEIDGFWFDERECFRKGIDYSPTCAYGTLGYRAPELLGDHPRFTKTSDIFSLGAVVYELLYGQKLFSTHYRSLHYYHTGELPIFQAVTELERERNVRQFLSTVPKAMLQPRRWMRPNVDAVMASLKSISVDSTEVICLESEMSQYNLHLTHEG